MARHGRARPAGAGDEPGGARGHPPERARVRRALASQLRRAAMIHQLRIREAFHARFRDHAARLMRHHGFRILDMWESTSDRRLEFVYLLEWPDEAARDTAWRAFMGDQEWSEIKRQTAAHHGDLVGAIEDRTLRRTQYGPRSPRTRTARPRARRAAGPA